MEKLCHLYYEKLKNHPVMEVEPPGGQRHFALAVVGKRQYLGWNNSKTRPQLRRKMYDGSIIAGHHAETHVLYKVPKALIKKAKFYVCRIGKKGNLMMSKPCKHCTQTLLTSGVLAKNIWFTDKQGEWKCLDNYLTGE